MASNSKRSTWLCLPNPEIKGVHHYRAARKSVSQFMTFIPEPLSSLYLVVDAWAMIFPPMGFLGSAANIAAPSTWATTWLVITTATPN